MDSILRRECEAHTLSIPKWGTKTLYMRGSG
jgi:hypothetical protein